MATTKKTTTRKSAPKKTTAKKTTTKAAVAKKAPVTAAKKAPAKRKTAVKRTSAKKKQPEMRSFQLAQEQGDFTTFRITRQTIYWIILVAFIIFAQLWILKLQIEVATLIDAQMQQLGL